MRIVQKVKIVRFCRHVYGNLSEMMTQPRSAVNDTVATEHTIRHLFLAPS